MAGRKKPARKAPTKKPARARPARATIDGTGPGVAQEATEGSGAALVAAELPARVTDSGERVR